MSADDDELLRFKRPGQDFELRRYPWEGFHATGPDAIRGDRMLVLAGFQQDRLLTSMGDEPPIEAEMAIMNLADGKLTRLGTAHGCWSIDTNVPQPRIGLAWRTPTTQPRLGNCVTYIDP